jgi:type VI secretion system protein ImpJ
MERKGTMPGLPAISEIPSAVQWHEGMLLCPQHFQQQDARSDALSHLHNSVSSPFPWGVLRYDVDRARLVAARFRLNELEAVMPEGLAVVLDGENHDGLSVDISAHEAAARAGGVVVFLAVARHRTGAALVEGHLARFDSVSEAPVADLNTGDNEVEMPRLRARLQLFVGEPPPMSYTSFPLATIGFEDGAFRLTDFLPACLAIEPGSPVDLVCRGLATRLREKASAITDQSAGPNGGADEPLSMQSRSLVHALTAALPAFEAILATGTAHPFALYLALCDVVGQVAGAGASGVAPLLEPYDHNNLRESFERACAYVNGVIDGIRENYAARRFVREDDRFSIELPAALDEGALTVGMRAGAGMDQDALSQWLLTSLIGTQDRIDSMLARRVLGPNRHAIDREPRLGLIPPRGVVLFSIERAAEYVESEGTLVIMNLNAGPLPAEILFYTAAPVK